MSRLGKKPIQKPENVDIAVKGATVTVKGPKGEMTVTVDHRMAVEVKGSEVFVNIPMQSKELRAKQGLFRTLIFNSVEGVVNGFSKDLEVQGVGYRVQLQGKNLQFSLGYSHPVSFPAPEGIAFEVEGTNKIKVSGIDKQKVGQVSAEIRALRAPDAYKGKGVRFVNEQIVLKPGKSVKK